MEMLLWFSFSLSSSDRPDFHRTIRTSIHRNSSSYPPGNGTLRLVALALERLSSSVLQEDFVQLAISGDAPPWDTQKQEYINVFRTNISQTVTSSLLSSAFAFRCSHLFPAVGKSSSPTFSVCTSLLLALQP